MNCRSYRVADLVNGKIDYPFVQITDSDCDIFITDYCVAIGGLSIWIPRNTTTNYATLGIGKLIFDVKNDTQLACAVHDFLYSKKGYKYINKLRNHFCMFGCSDRLVADVTFQLILSLTVKSPFKVWAYYKAVRLFGGKFFQGGEE
jgi:hypothetical protein